MHNLYFKTLITYFQGNTYNCPGKYVLPWEIYILPMQEVSQATMAVLAFELLASSAMKVILMFVNTSITCMPNF